MKKKTVSKKSKKIRKVLVANRGEIALRVFHTCHELGIGSVAVYSEADSRSPHRFGADESVCIGPAASSESYLNMARVIEAAKETGADAIHPGYGFLSENAEFSAMCEEAGIIFIGPRAESIRSMGDKVEARKIMQAAGVPVTPGSDGPVESEEELIATAKQVGFPLLVKASAGGGGKGIRRVDSEDELVEAWQRAASEAGSAFGDATVYIEKLVVNARHVEAQVVGDGVGGAIFFGERDCSLQRNHQKVVEESPSPAVDEEVRDRIRQASLAGVKAIKYRGAGTMEYLYDEASRDFYFLEMNTRLQVEHPVTEMVTGVDLVAEQIRVAEGNTLEGREEPIPRGHAVEFRVYAEDPYRGFIPSTGEVRGLRLPHAPFTRFDASLREGYEITPFYDPMLGKAMAWGATREEAIDRLDALLSRTRIGGIHTSIPLGIEICRWQAFRDGSSHTGSLEEWLAERQYLPKEMPELSKVFAGIVARDALRGGYGRRQKATPAEPGEWGEAARLENTGRRPR